MVGGEGWNERKVGKGNEAAGRAYMLGDGEAEEILAQEACKEFSPMGLWV